MSKNCLLVEAVYDDNPVVFTDELNEKLKRYSLEGRLHDVTPIPALYGFGAYITYWDKPPVDKQLTKDVEQVKPKDIDIGQL